MQLSDNPKSAHEIGEVVGAAEATIKQAYALMQEPRAKELFPHDFQFKSIECLSSSLHNCSYNPAMVCCPDHPEAILINDFRAGEQICSECGLVVGDRVIDISSEWRTLCSDGTVMGPTSGLVCREPEAGMQPAVPQRENDGRSGNVEKRYIEDV